MTCYITVVISQSSSYLIYCLHMTYLITSSSYVIFFHLVFRPLLSSFPSTSMIAPSQFHILVPLLFFLLKLRVQSEWFWLFLIFICIQFLVDIAHSVTLNVIHMPATSRFQCLAQIFLTPNSASLFGYLIDILNLTYLKCNSCSLPPESSVPTVFHIS